MDDTSLTSWLLAKLADFAGGIARFLEDTNAMTWLLLATGFTGALTVSHLRRMVRSWFTMPSSLEVFHSPKGGCTEAVVREIQKARKEVLVQAYSFTSK